MSNENLHKYKEGYAKSFLSHSAALISISFALSQTLDYVPVYSTALVGTHCAYPLRDGQAELSWGWV